MSQGTIFVVAVVIVALAIIAYNVARMVQSYRAAPPLPGGYRRFRLLWEPRDLWVGVYRDPANRRTYVCPLPCVVILIERYGDQ